MDLKIRKEETRDFNSVFKINSKSFESDAEAILVDSLRTKTPEYISLVAELENKVVGHILFTPVELSENKNLKIMGLAPMAVEPTERNKSIGSKLIKAGIEECKELEYGAVVVLGHPNYYPKFGFKKSSIYNIKSEYDVSEEVFMCLELIDSYLKDYSGLIKYHPAFNTL